MDGKPRVSHKRRPKEQHAAVITKGRVSRTSTSSSSTSSSPQRTATSSQSHDIGEIDAPPPVVKEQDDGVTDHGDDDDDVDDDDDDDLRDYIALHHKGRRKLTSRNTLAELPLLTLKAISDLLQNDGDGKHNQAQLLASYQSSFECWFKQALYEIGRAHV